jgi:succinate dehydrogenase hydrophobic anchor subunit
VSVDLETRPGAEAPPGRSGTRAWRATAASGVAVLALVTVHMVAHHFVVEEVGGLRTYRQVLAYVGNPLIIVLESVFLVVVTWHGLLGLRSVLFDFGLTEIAKQRVSRGLAVLGVATVGYGLVLIGVLASRS